jgi:hypothetical protein
MYFFFADDSRCNKPSIKGMGPLVAIGGIYIEDSELKLLNEEINKVCLRYGFPANEPFKWSPGRELWMWDHLVDDKREKFFIDVIRIAENRKTGAIIVAEDISRNTATSAITPELDITCLFFERANWRLQKLRNDGMIIIDRPGGNRQHEDKFLYDCSETLRQGTDYMNMDRLILNVCTSTKYTRALQLADLITGCTLAAIGGENNFSPPIFDKIKRILCKDSDRIGGVGLKIHPDYLYVNLYHWLLGDSHYIRRNSGWPLPLESRPYTINPYAIQQDVVSLTEEIPF